MKLSMTGCSKAQYESIPFTRIVSNGGKFVKLCVNTFIVGIEDRSRGLYSVKMCKSRAEAKGLFSSILAEC